MGCDLCGRDGVLVKCNVEGVVLNVCSFCSSYGNVIKSKVRVRRGREEVSNVVVSSIGIVVRNWRESNGLTQKELAIKLSEKESLVRKVENGFIPSLSLAKKFERLVGSKLVCVEKVETGSNVSEGSGMTIGDLFK